MPAERYFVDTDLAPKLCGILSRAGIPPFAACHADPGWGLGGSH